MYRLLFVALPLLLSACAIASDAPQPGYPHAIQLNCSGSLSGMEDCNEEAKRQCPNGYKVLGSAAPDTLPNTNIHFRRDAPGTPVEDRHYFGTQRGMLIICTDTKKPTPMPVQKNRRPTSR